MKYASFEGSFLTYPTALLLIECERSVVVAVESVFSVHVGLELREGDGRVSEAEASGKGAEVND